MRRIAVCLVAVGATVGSVVACGDDGQGSRADSVQATDGVEAETEVEFEVEVEVEFEVESESETEPETEPETESETESDVATESETETESEVTPPAPPAAVLTIAEIPLSMNGAVPSLDPPLTWRLRANRAHLTLDVLPEPTSGPIDAIAITCQADGVDQPLPPLEAAPDGHQRIVIDPASAFPDGAQLHCDATITGPGGEVTSRIDFDAATLPPELDPFPATDEWLIVLSRDIFHVNLAEHLDGTAALTSDYIPGGDGVPDFDEAFFALGLFPADHAAEHQAIRQHLLGKFRSLVYQIYGLDPDGAPTAEGVNLRIYLEGDAGAPLPSDYGGARRFSKIALGGDGDPEDQASSVFGRARVDWNNQDTEDDTVYGLGVFPSSLARTVLGQPAGAIILADIRPGLGGQPFGSIASDAAFIGRDVELTTLPPAVQDRARLYQILIDFGALGLAAILTHEVGHSLGLVPVGLPPEGLFAGIDVDFVVAVAPDAHIDTEGLNVMQTGGSVNWLEVATGDSPRFEPLSWAYLKRMLVVGTVAD